MTNEHKSEYDCLIDSLLKQPKVVCRNKLLLFWLPTCLGSSYSIVLHFHLVSGPVPPAKIGGIGSASALGAEKSRHCCLFVRGAYSCVKTYCTRVIDRLPASRHL